MAITYINTSNSTGNNPTSGSWTIPAGAAAGDIIVCWWYTLTNTKTLTINTSGFTVTSKRDVNSAGFGHFFVGYRRMVAGDTTSGWTSSSAANATTIYGTSVYRGVNASGDPFEAESGAPATWSNAINPDPPSVTTVANNAMVVAIFGKNNDYTSISPPSGYTSGGANSSTAGTDASAGVAHVIKASFGAENPGAWTLGGGATTDDGYVWTGALKAQLDTNCVPTTASITTATYAPTVTVTLNQRVTPTTAALTLTTYAPTIKHTITVPPAALTLTTYAPTIKHGIIVPTRALSLTTYAPTVLTPVVCTPPPATLTIATYEPTVTASSGLTVIPGPAALTLATYAPTIKHGIIVPPAALTLTPYAPTVEVTQNVVVRPETAALSITTWPPSVSVSGGSPEVPAGSRLRWM